MEQVGDDQTNEVAAAGDQAASQDVWLIVKFSYSPENPFPCLLSDVRMVSKNLGNGHHRESQILCDVFHAHGHKRHYTGPCGSIRRGFPRRHLPWSGKTSRLWWQNSAFHGFGSRETGGCAGFARALTAGRSTT